MPDSDTYNKSHTSNVDLLPTFWNKDKDRAWRLDIDLVVQEADGSESEKESEEESEDESGDESESGNESEECNKSEYSKEEC